MLNSLQALINEPEITQIDDPEEIFTTSEVSWNQYEALFVTSELLPELDIALLEQCVFISDQIEAIDAFEQGLKT